LLYFVVARHSSSQQTASRSQFQTPAAKSAEAAVFQTERHQFRHRLRAHVDVLLNDLFDRQLRKRPRKLVAILNRGGLNERRGDWPFEDIQLAPGFF
jgi:hypothetical protein